jgi:putative addiction module component (TIGR02574 family)
LLNAIFLVLLCMAPQLAEILKLSLPERILWAEAIWNSITADNKSFDKIQLSAKEKKYLDKVAIEFEANPHQGSSWKEVKKRILSAKK